MAPNYMALILIIISRQTCFTSPYSTIEQSSTIYNRVISMRDEWLIHLSVNESLFGILNFSSLGKKDKQMRIEFIMHTQHRGDNHEAGK